MNKDNSESQDTRAGLIDHPLVGQYVQNIKSNSWFAQTPVGNHNYPIDIGAPGKAPTAVQIDSMIKLLAHLPDIIASSNLPEAPTNEWMIKHPDYRLVNARISVLYLYEDGSFYVCLNAYPEDDWSPTFEIFPDFKVKEAAWDV
ncbi:hypothetical protein ACO0LD_28305 [Undibacterium sp. Ji83W]|uniref:hypothetical protein n=1 Tax=Undibacterium sp. Ji83W TaxID=3413043 RepID=UPI003BF2C0A1